MLRKWDPFITTFIRASGVYLLFIWALAGFILDYSSSLNIRASMGYLPLFKLMGFIFSWDIITGINLVSEALRISSRPYHRTFWHFTQTRNTGIIIGIALHICKINSNLCES